MVFQQMLVPAGYSAGSKGQSQQREGDDVLRACVREKISFT
jgi:hypothetical protein